MNRVRGRLSEYLPPDYANLGREITAQIGLEHAKLEGMTTLNARLRYVQLCRSLKTYGVTFFPVQEAAVLSQKKRDKPLDILLGVSRDSVMRMDVSTKVCKPLAPAPPPVPPPVPPPAC